LFGGFFVCLEKRTCDFAFVSYVTGEAGRKCVRYMPWPQAAECNMITNKQAPAPGLGVPCVAPHSIKYLDLIIHPTLFGVYLKSLVRSGLIHIRYSNTRSLSLQ
jgi:hypothetical protein